MGNFYTTNRFDQVKHVTVMKCILKRAKPTDDGLEIFFWED